MSKRESIEMYEVLINRKTNKHMFSIDHFLYVRNTDYDILSVAGFYNNKQTEKELTE